MKTFVVIDCLTLDLVVKIPGLDLRHKSRGEYRFFKDDDLVRIIPRFSRAVKSIRDDYISLASDLRKHLNGDRVNILPWKTTLDVKNGVLTIRLPRGSVMDYSCVLNSRRYPNDSTSPNRARI